MVLGSSYSVTTDVEYLRLYKVRSVSDLACSGRLWSLGASLTCAGRVAVASDAAPVSAQLLVQQPALRSVTGVSATL